MAPDGAPCGNCVATEAAKVMVERWLSFFPDPVFLVTDGGTHFTAALFRELSRLRGFDHHITTPHSPWTHGDLTAWSSTA